MPFIRRLALVAASTLIVSAETFAQKPTYQQEATVPAWVTSPWTKAGLDKTYAFDAHLNPFCLRGDFDGDGVADFAILIKAQASGKSGIAIIHRGSGLAFVVGAGKSLGNGGDNSDWMDTWTVFDKAPGAGKADLRRPALKGDALLVAKTESASALVWWDGTRYRWYQQGN